MVSRTNVESVPPITYPDWDSTQEITPAEAENLLVELAAVFLNDSSHQPVSADPSRDQEQHEELPNADAIYRALVEQIPAVVFMAHLDRGIG